MTGKFSQGCFHFVYITKFIQKGLVLCLLPMIRALFRFDLESLYTALHQDAVILLVMIGASILLWRRGGYQLDANQLTLCFGFFSWRRRVIPFREIAVLELDRPLWLRALGATRVTLYTARTTHSRSMRFYLSKHRASYLAEQMLPVASDTVLFAPAGGERVRFVMLSANVAASAALFTVSIQQTGRLLGHDVENLLNHVAMDNFSRFEQLVELFLPAGLAWLFTLGFLLWGLALFGSLLTTSGFKVSRSGGVIMARGGWVHHIERRVLASAINYCDVRQSPSARLLHRFPVYLCAGSFSGGSIPFLIYKKGQEDLLRALLPAFHLDALDPGPTADRSWPMFLWKGGTLFGVSAVLMSVSAWQLPQLTPLFLPLLFAGFGMMLSGVEGRQREGAARQTGGSLRVCYTKHFTRHDLCVLTRDLSYTTMQTPFSENVARCTLRISLPCGQKLRVRGLKLWQVQRLHLID